MSEEIQFRPPRPPLVSPGEMDLHVSDLTATVAADVTLGAFQSALRAHNQWFPIDGGADSAIGLLVETNSTGPLRFGFGAWRDLLLGTQFYNGRGELITAGGRTMKNVAGYDLTKFMVGQHGVFGRLATLTMRTYRRPEGAIVAQYEPDVRRFMKLVPTALRPQWAALTCDALLLGYIGDAAAVRWYAANLSATKPVELKERSIDEDIAHRAGLWRATDPYRFRAAIPPAKLNEFAARLADASEWTADAAFGVVLGSAQKKTVTERIRQAAESVGGCTIIWEEGKQPSLSPHPSERPVIERLKRAFDPDGTLQPLPW